MFFHGTKDFLNVLLDKQKRPDASLLPTQFILMDDSWNSDDETHLNGRISSKYNLLIFFVKKSDLKDTFNQRKAHMRDMIEAKNEFIYKLQRSANVEKLTGIKSTAQYNTFDLNCDGIALTMTVELTNDGINYCFPGPTYQVDATGNFVLDGNGKRILV